MRVVVWFFDAGLMHMFVAVLGSVVVGVGVLVLDVLVFVRGVRVRMRHPVVLMLVRVRSVMVVLISHLRSSPLCETPCLAWFLDDPQSVVGAVVPRYPGAGVLGVEHGVHDKLAHMLVFQAVENRGALATGSHQPGHPQLG